MCPHTCFWCQKLSYDPLSWCSFKNICKHVINTEIKLPQVGVYGGRFLFPRKIICQTTSKNKKATIYISTHNQRLTGL